MADTENTKRVRDRVAAVTKPDSGAADNALRDESTLYGDDVDIPVRARKKTGSTSSGARKKKKPVAKKAGKQKKRRSGILGLFGDKYIRHKFKNIYELMNGSDGESKIKPIRVFKWEIRLWPLLVFAFVVVLASGVMLNNSNLYINEQKITVVGLPEEMEGYRIVVLSDMNGRRFGDEQSLLLRTLNSIKYDAIFCLGDMVGKGGNAEPFYEFLDGLKNPEKVYFICGDSDPGPFAKAVRGTSGKLANLVLEDWIVGAIERGANYVDAPVQLPMKESTVWISPATMLNLETTSTREYWENQMKQEQEGYLAGIAEDRESLPMTSYRYQAMQKLYDVQRTMRATDIHISLAHIVPTDEYIYTSEEHDPNVDRYLVTPELIVAGHYCGGVWRIPLLGALYVPDSTLPRGGWFPDQSKVKGLSSVGETQVFCSTGLSTNGNVPLMPFRLFNSPEIAVLTLTSTLPENMLEAG